MTTTTAPSLLIPMTADIGGLEIARLQARQFLENNAVDEHTVAGVELIIEEAVTNTLRYGYEVTDAEEHMVELDLQIEPHEVRLLIVDDAKPFDPMDADALLLPETLDDAQVGGLGLLMIRNTASSMAYERRDGFNRFLLTVARRGADGEPL
jgi:anti-sigma regulatory factor (Ser/Thr protein kinase)